MKKIGTVLKFELGSYFGNKTYLISTILICLLCVGIMFIPPMIDKDGKESTKTEETGEDGETNAYGIYDAAGVADTETLAVYFPGYELKTYDDEAAMKKAVEDEALVFAFTVKSVNEFDYYLYNKSMFDENIEIVRAYMSMLVKKNYCEINNLDEEAFFTMENTEIKANENVLGKDSTENYWYCYVLVIIIFMIIVMYGTQIATAVANEKSNRSIEILVTSTSSIALLFGKVFAGVIASIIQVGLVGASLLGSYQCNKDYWGDSIAMFLDIPTNVLVTFAVFGIGGFLIYAFMYGALGALVSKIEDLNKSAGTAQMLVMIVYFVVLLQLTNVDGLAIKICSFLPISSYSAMFARVAMGNVATWEVVVSAVILYASVILVGIIGGKIFRNSTLRYGNPIKLSTALKGLKKKL